MVSIHTLNKAKAEAALLKRGWLRGLQNTWIAPLGRGSSPNMEQDWTEAILESIECPLEEQLKQNKEFIKKHPTPKR
jgi:hypothetical protein